MSGRIEQGPESDPHTVSEAETTTSVGTGGKTVYTADNNAVSARVLVMGVADRDSTITFVDEALYCTNGSATKVASATRGSPDDSTYGVSGDELTLTMGGGSYDVTAHGLEQLP